MEETDTEKETVRRMRPTAKGEDGGHSDNKVHMTGSQLAKETIHVHPTATKAAK